MDKQSKTFYVEIDGVSYRANGSLGAMLLFKEQTGKEVNEINGLSDTIVWLWCCVKSGSAKSSNPLTLSCQEFADACTMDVLDEWTKAQATDRESKKKSSKGNRKESMNS